MCLAATRHVARIVRFQRNQRSSGRSRHANHPGPSPAVQEKITPHIPQKKIGPPFFNFPPYFFKVADLRFNTFFDTKRAIRRCWRSLRALRMLPIDSPSNSTLNGMFASHFRKRSLAKIQKIPKNLSGHFPNPSRKKNRDLNRISLTLSNRASLTPALISFATPFIVSSEHCTFMHKVQLANGASHGHNSFPTHPSRRPLLHNFPIMGSPELSQC